MPYTFESYTTEFTADGLPLPEELFADGYAAVYPYITKSIPHIRISAPELLTELVDSIPRGVGSDLVRRYIVSHACITDGDEAHAAVKSVMRLAMPELLKRIEAGESVPVKVENRGTHAELRAADE